MARHSEPACRQTGVSEESPDKKHKDQLTHETRPRPSPLHGISLRPLVDQDDVTKWMVVQKKINTLVNPAANFSIQRQGY